MFGIGPSELIVIVTIIVVIGIFSKFGTGLRVSGPTLVLREFKIDEAATDGLILKIVGRVSGIKAWLLTIMGFDAETTLAVSTKDVSFRSSSLSGEINRLAPFASISSTNCGFYKPISFFILGIIFILLGLIGGIISRQLIAGIPAIILGIVFFVIYSLNKKIIISIETKGSSFIGLSFKRSVIENVAVNIDEAKKAIKLVNGKLVSSQLKWLIFTVVAEQNA